MDDPIDTSFRFRDPRHQFGLEVEQRAARWLERRGWRVLAHRFQLGSNDLDLVIRRGAVVAFVEVKARRGPWCGQGMEAVGSRKRAIVERLAWSWLVRHGSVGDLYRFDVISVLGMPGREKIRHIEDAWRPGWFRHR